MRRISARALIICLNFYSSGALIRGGKLLAIDIADTIVKKFPHYK